MLNQEERKRYNRHLILDNVGLEGQLKIKTAKVLVIGAGGLGCPVLQYLSAAGVGTIGVIDFDTVDVTNLQRQVLFNVSDIGRNKAQAASDRLAEKNPHVKFEVYPERLTTNNAIDLFSKYDIVVDGSDNFATRYLVNDASIISKKPLVYGSIYKFQGQLAVFNYGNGPSYRCLFPTPPKAGTIKNCSEIGVIGVLPGVIGTQQANEALKIILEIGDVLTGKLLIYDALKASYFSVGVSRNENEIQTVLEQASSFAEIDYEIFCGVANNKGPGEFEISVNELEGLIGKKNVRIIDLREEWEEPQIWGENIERIVMGEFLNKVNRFSGVEKIVVICQTGLRSSNVKEILAQQYDIKGIFELKGGMESYEKR